MPEPTNHIGGSPVGPFAQVATVHGGLHFHGPRSAPEACHALPPDEGFAGREPDLAVLTDVLSDRTTTPDTEIVLVCTVAGLAGVGKTALAVRAARDFSGRVLFVDLHGYDPARLVEPLAALAMFLRALGVLDEHIPPELGAREALYRSILTRIGEAGERVLVIADNAARPDQVLPLRPTGVGHRMVVTSRNNLPIPGARRIEVDVLPPADARAVLTLALRATNPGDTRMTDEPAAAAELTALCGHLPLALRITAELLADQPELPVADLVRLLSAAQDRLGELAYGETVAVRAAFDASYQHLSHEQRRVFRLLALNPGPHVSLAAATALAGEPEHVVRRTVAALRRAHLLQPVSGGTRYRFHDLLRLYAQSRCHEEEPSDERTDAVHRLLDHYRDAAWEADSHLNVGHFNDLSGESGTNRFEDRFAAMAWLDAEQENLVASAELAATAGFDTHSQDLPICLYAYFDLRKRWEDWILVSELGLAAAVRLGDRRGQAAIHNRLGAVHRELHRFDDAIDCHLHALAGWREIGDRRSVAVTLTCLGNDYLDATRFDDAVRCFQEALGLLSEPGDQPARGITLTSLGNAHYEMGRPLAALDCYHDALAISRECGDRYGEGLTLTNLGLVHDHLREFDAALDCHQEALTICRELGDRYGEAQTLGNLGLIHWTVDRRSPAVDCWTRALAIFDGLNVPDLATRVRAALTITGWLE